LARAQNVRKYAKSAGENQVKQIDHSQHSWKVTERKLIKQKPKSEYTDRLDRDGLSWEDRKRVNQIKDDLTYRDNSVDPFEEM